MAIISQGSFLGEAANRLYRGLDLDGQVRLQTDDTIQPVVIIGDLTTPGMGTARNRRFFGGAGPVAGPANVCGLFAYEGVIIDRVTVSCDQNAGADTLTFRLCQSTVGPARSAAFIDRSAGSGDLAPVGGGTITTTTVIGTGMSVQVPASAVSATYFFEMIKRPIFLPAGFSLFLSCLTARTMFVNFEGRTF